jgi:predicted CXXCH cytochrome family protein
MAGLLLALFSFSLPAVARGGGDYAGSKVCADCHAKTSADWLATKHARAFTDLARTGQDDLPACVPCHVTGHDRPGGFVDKEITPLLAGVQCEACHGPGARHAASGDPATLVSAPGREVCRQCHTPSQDPGFDYAAKARGVHQAAAGPLKPARASLLSALPDRLIFGSVNEGKPATATVIVQNTGGRDVTITNVRTN